MQLHSFLVTQVLLYNHIVVGVWTGNSEYIFALIAEIRNLGWPCRWISDSLRKLPRRHSTHMVRGCRLIGRALKHIEFEALSNLIRPYDGMRHASSEVFKYLLADGDTPPSSSSASSESDSTGSTTNSSTES